MYDIPSLQSRFLNDLIQGQQPVILYLKNGHKLRGTVMGMNLEVIFFRSSMTEVIYKKMILSILPIKQKIT